MKDRITFSSITSLKRTAPATWCTRFTTHSTAKRAASSFNSSSNWYWVLCPFQSSYLPRNLTTASCVWAEIRTPVPTVFFKRISSANAKHHYHLTIQLRNWDLKGTIVSECHSPSLLRIKRTQAQKLSRCYSDSVTNPARAPGYINTQAA